MKFANLMLLPYVPVIISVLAFLIQYKKLGRALQVFSLFVFFSGVIQFTSLYFWYRSINNLPLLHIYAAVGFILLAWFYKVVLGNFVRSWIIWGMAALFASFCIISAIYIQPIFTFNSYPLIVEAVFVIILSLFTFIYLLNDTVREYGMAGAKAISWINSGLFIYFFSCFLIYYFGDIINNHFTLTLRRIAWLFHAFFSVVMYVCFLIGLWKR